MKMIKNISPTRTIQKMRRYHALAHRRVWLVRQDSVTYDQVVDWDHRSADEIAIDAAPVSLQDAGYDEAQKTMMIETRVYLVQISMSKKMEWRKSLDDGIDVSIIDPPEPQCAEDGDGHEWEDVFSTPMPGMRYVERCPLCDCERHSNPSASDGLGRNMRSISYN